MRVQQLLSADIPNHLAELNWLDLLAFAGEGSQPAFAAVFGRRRGLAWHLVRRATAYGLEDPDAVLLEGIWRAIVRNPPTEEAFYASVHSHLLNTVRKARRRQAVTIPIDDLVGVLSDGGGRWDPVGNAAVDAVAARQVLATVPHDLVRAAADRLSGRVERLAAADRQRLRRWRLRNADLLAGVAA